MVTSFVLYVEFCFHISYIYFVELFEIFCVFGDIFLFEANFFIWNFYIYSDVIFLF
jgi:hypothetical protein